MLRHYLRNFIPYPCTRCERLPTCSQVPRSHVPAAFCDANPPRRHRSTGSIKRRPVLTTPRGLTFTRAVALPEAELRASMATLDRPAGMSAKDGQVLYFNEFWTTITGQSPEDWRGFGWLDALHPEDRTPVLRQLRGQDAPPKPGLLVYRYLQPGGGWATYRARVAPRINMAGDFLGFFGAELREPKNAALTGAGETGAI